MIKTTCQKIFKPDLEKGTLTLAFKVYFQKYPNKKVLKTQYGSMKKESIQIYLAINLLLRLRNSKFLPLAKGVIII